MMIKITRTTADTAIAAARSRELGPPDFLTVVGILLSVLVFSLSSSVVAEVTLSVSGNSVVVWVVVTMAVVVGGVEIVIDVIVVTKLGVKLNEVGNNIEMLEFNVADTVIDGITDTDEGSIVELVSLSGIIPLLSLSPDPISGKSVGEGVISKDGDVPATFVLHLMMITKRRLRR